MYLLLNDVISKNIRTRRIQAGFTQSELAKQVGTSGLIISRIETGRVSKVSLEVISRLEKALEVTPGFFSNLTRDAEEIKLPTKTFYCRNCGAHLYSDSKFCHLCGTKVLK